MPKIKWDQVGDRVFERGVDQGVLYLKDGSGVPWNGLTAVTQQPDKTSEPVYFDGRKINDHITLGDFKAILRAITYPDEFLEMEGFATLSATGVYLGDQQPQTFGLSYRTKVGSDTDQDANAYKIHIVYNATAIPSDKNFNTITMETTLTEFEWQITAVPEEIPGFRPTAHVVIDSRTIDPVLLSDIELALYGGTTANPQLPAFADLMEMVTGYFRVEVIDNKDGTWTAITNFDGYISMLPDGKFQIDGVNATYLDDDTYQLEST